MSTNTTAILDSIQDRVNEMRRIFEGAGVEPECSLTPAQVAEGWIEWHGGENPVPGKRVEVIGRNLPNNEDLSDDLYWQSRRWAGDIIAYRIIEPKTRTIKLGPKDIAPGCALRHKTWVDEGSWMMVSGNGLRTVIGWINGNMQCHSYEHLLKEWEINRSLSLGKWDADAWEPCSKEVEV